MILSGKTFFQGLEWVYKRTGNFPKGSNLYCKYMQVDKQNVYDRNSTQLLTGYHPCLITSIKLKYHKRKENSVNKKEKERQKMEKKREMTRMSLKGR